MKIIAFPETHVKELPQRPPPLKKKSIVKYYLKDINGDDNDGYPWFLLGPLYAISNSITHHMSSPFPVSMNQGPNFQGSFSKSALP